VKIAWLYFLVACLLSPAAWAQTQATQTKAKLTGIVNLDGQRRALLEIYGDKWPAFTSRPILREGERDGNVELTKIDEQAGAVHVRMAGTEEIISLERTRGVPPQARQEPAASQLLLRPHSSDVAQVLNVYAELTGRTILRALVLPSARVDLQSEAPISRSEAVRTLEGALAEQGIMMTPCGEKFVAAVDMAAAKQTKAIPLPPAPGTGGEASFAPGAIDLEEADLFQVLDVYQGLTARTVLRWPMLPAFRISLRNQSALSRSEAIYAFELALALNHLSLVPHEEKFVFAVPTAAVARLDSVPKLPAEEKPADLSEYPPGLIKFLDVEVASVLKVYAALTGRAVTTPATLPPSKITIRSQTPLTRREAIHAFDAVLALNDIQVVIVDEKHAQAVHRPLGGTAK
jgi:hypothetical protein